MMALPAGRDPRSGRGGYFLSTHSNAKRLRSEMERRLSLPGISAWHHWLSLADHNAVADPTGY